MARSVIAAVATAVVTRQAGWLVATPAVGYSLAWIDQFLFEGDRSATSGAPFFSLPGDRVMLRDQLSRRLPR